MKSTLPNCGCDVEVQTFLAGAKKDRKEATGASSILALAMKVGDVTFYIDQHLKLQVSGTDGEADLDNDYADYADAPAESFFSGSLAQKVGSTPGPTLSHCPHHRPHRGREGRTKDPPPPPPPPLPKLPVLPSLAPVPPGNTGVHRESGTTEQEKGWMGDLVAGRGGAARVLVPQARGRTRRRHPLSVGLPAGKPRGGEGPLQEPLHTGGSPSK